MSCMVAFYNYPLNLSRQTPSYENIILIHNYVSEQNTAKGKKGAPAAKARKPEQQPTAKSPAPVKPATPEDIVKGCVNAINYMKDTVVNICNVLWGFASK